MDKKEKTVKQRLGELELKVAALEEVTSPSGRIFTAIVHEGGEAFNDRRKIRDEMSKMRVELIKMMDDAYRKATKGGEVKSPSNEGSPEFEKLKKQLEEAYELYAKQKATSAQDVSLLASCIGDANSRIAELKEKNNRLVVHCTINTVAVILALVTIALLR